MNRIRLLLRNRAFARLWAAQMLSLMAVYALNLVVVVLVERLTHSSVQMGITLVTITAPGLLAGLLAGPVVDRMSRRVLLMLTSSARALVSGLLLLGVKTLRGVALLPVLYAANMAVSALNQFTAPAEAALLPSLVKKADLIAANSLLNLGQAVAQGVGIVILGPVLIKTLGPASVPLMALILCVGAALNAAALPEKGAPRPTKASEEGLLAQLREGWRLIAADRLLKMAVSRLTLASVILLALSTLLPGFVARILHWDVAAAPLIFIPMGTGFLLGLYLLNRSPLASFARYERWIGSGMAAVGAAISLISITKGSPLVLFVAMCVIVGVGAAFILIPTKTILQQRPPVNLRGRVISTQMVLVNVFSLGPMLFSGGFADILGIEPAMFLVGMAAVGAGARSLLSRGG